MKAVIYKRNGSSVPFVFTEVKKPSPKDDELLIKIYASTINAADYRLTRMGLGIPKRKSSERTSPAVWMPSGKTSKNIKLAMK
jgi:NADPH:quinone reductase-like Zn-dependent oxidoreductase